MECPGCKNDIPENSRFCIACGAPLSSACSSCGSFNPARATFCAQCGHKLRESGLTTAASLLASAPSPPEVSAERRQLTVMFVDLVGSTALAAGLDPEDMRDIIGAYHRKVDKVVGQYDGFVAKYMGDGVLVYFGYPQAHEDDVERAVRAGLAVVDAVGQLPGPER